MNWIDTVLNAYSESETPRRFFYWSALSVLSAAVGKKLYLERHYYKLYLNTFTILVSKGSGLRKGTPISMASGIVEELNCTRVVEGRSSIQGIIQAFSVQTTLENGLVLSDAQGILISGELDSMLVKDPEALTILTALYNTHEHKKKWTNTLKSSPTESLKNPCISILGASNEVLLEDFVMKKDTEGGFFARTFMVHESKTDIINDLIDRPEIMISTKELSCYPKEVAKVKGEFIWTERAKDVYRPWYRDLRNLVHNDTTGSIERLGDQVLKVAMLISLSKDLGLELKSDDLDEAIFVCEECMLGVKHLMMGKGHSVDAPSVARVLKLLLVSPDHELSRQGILKKLWPDIDHISLDRIIDTLTQAGAIEDFRGSKGVHYRMKDEVANQYLKFKEN